MVSATVVGSGPNGLAAAVTLAREGVEVTVLEAADTIGGGSRSAELTIPGLIHDVCSAVHPTALTSPFLQDLDLAAHGLAWAWPEVDVAHPLDGGRAGILVRDIDETAARLGDGGAGWKRAVGPVARHLDDLAPDIFGPMIGLPERPLRMAGFGMRSLRPASWIARGLRSEEAAAAFGGLAAHAIHPLTRPGTGGIGLFFAAMLHRHGFPVAVGGSQALADALASLLVSLGGRIETGHRVTETPESDLVLFDTAPREALAIAGDRLPAQVRRSLGRWKHGPGAFKIDLAVEGGVPWTHADARRAGTVHLGGTFAEITAAERAVHRGLMPEAPFVLVGQQYLADPSRSAGDVHPVWAYAHVPHGYDGDATEAILNQFERFAPGARDRIVAQVTLSPAELEAHNANYIGGDIAGGANSLRQVVGRPRLSPHPYSLGSRGLYLCSASTPPGGGVHGMCGYRAASAGLADLGRLR